MAIKEGTLCLAIYRQVEREYDREDEGVEEEEEETEEGEEEEHQVSC